MTFLLYKLYRFAVAGQNTDDPAFKFVCYLMVFELLHLVVVALGLRIVSDIGPEYNFTLEPYKDYIVIILFAVCLTFNYLYFIRGKKIYNINDYYQGKNLKVWKGNLLFSSYIVFIFIIIFIEVYISNLSK